MLHTQPSCWLIPKLLIGEAVISQCVIYSSCIDFCIVYTFNMAVMTSQRNSDENFFVAPVPKMKTFY